MRPCWFKSQPGYPRIYESENKIKVYTSAKIVTKKANNLKYLPVVMY